MIDEVPSQATHKIEITVYVEAYSDERAKEISDKVQVALNEVPEIIKAVVD